MKRPAMAYGHAGKEEQPGYMKLTFSAGKNVSESSKILQLSTMLGTIKNLKSSDSSHLALGRQSDENLLK